MSAVRVPGDNPIGKGQTDVSSGIFVKNIHVHPTDIFIRFMDIDISLVGAVNLLAVQLYRKIILAALYDLQSLRRLLPGIRKISGTPADRIHSTAAAGGPANAFSGEYIYGK
jgi:hypothetical protein